MSDINTAIRVHLDAIRVLLDVLDAEKKPEKVMILEDPTCPKCGSTSIAPAPRTMGSTGREFQCMAISCDWQGELE